MDKNDPPPPSNRSLGRRLIGLAAACVLPVWLCAGVLVYFAYEGKKALLEERMAETARGLALAVDRELTIVLAAAEGLTTSPALAGDDFAAFRVQVRQVLPGYPHSDIVVADRDGQQVFNSYLPEGRPLPRRGVPETVRRVFETGRPSISNLFRGAVTGRALISLDMPVFQGGQVRYDLGMTVPAARFGDLLTRLGLPADWVASVLDDRRQVVARTHDIERLLGQPAGAALPHLAEGQTASGVFEAVNLDGVPVLAVLARAGATGWAVAVSVPRAVLLADLWTWLGWTAGGMALLFLLGLALALSIGRGIADSIKALLPPAQALGEGRPVAAGHFDLAETENVGRALERASRLLQHRDAERDAAEARRDAAEARLAESERIFRIVADNSYNWEYWNDPAGVCRWVSPACRRISGYAPEEFLGGDGIALRDIIDPDDLAAWDEHLSRVARGESSHDELQFRIRARDGGIVHIGHVCGPIEGQDGTYLGRRGCNRDVTEQYRYEQDLREAKDMADAGSRAKSEFLANMSHEIRTPLGGVMSMLGLLETTPLDAEQAEYVQMAARASARLTRLLSDILDLSKVESGKLTLQEGVFALEDVRQAVLDIFSPMARQKGLDLVFDLGPGLPPRFVGDDARLRQILLNLVGNAVKYTDAGGVRITVSPAGPDAGQPGHGLAFAVADTGCGIPADRIGDIFQPFVQAEGSYVRRGGGVGLGLAIVSRLVGLMRGRIEAESEAGRGTVMRVFLPLAPAPPAPRPASAGEGPAAPGRSLAILVAEDDPTNAFAVDRLLRKSGHRPTLCRNGAEVLDRLVREPFDCVLMDVQMPVMDGVEATRRIRQDVSGRFDPSIVVIAMTAYAMAGDRERFLSAGMDDYVAKPVDVEHLLGVVKRAMAGHGGPGGGRSGGVGGHGGG